MPSRWFLLISLALAVAAAAAPPLLEDLGALPPAELLTTSNSTLTAATDDTGAPVWRWALEAGQTATLAVRPDHPLLDRLRYYDQFSFDVRIAAGEVGSVNFQALGHVSGPRQYKLHDWQVAILTTPRRQWHARCFFLDRPNWFPWDVADGLGDAPRFGFEGVALVPGTIVEFRLPRLVRARLLLKPDYELPITWPVLSRAADGAATYTLTHLVQNASGRPVDIVATVLSSHSQFAVALQAPSGPAGPAASATDTKVGQRVAFTLRATLTAAQQAQLPELYSEPLTLAFHPADEPAARILWQGCLTRPLSDSVRSQALLSDELLASLRQVQAGQDEATLKAVPLTPILKSAEAFLAKRLETIPPGHRRVGNNYPGDWLPGDRMPEAVNRKTGEREYDTALAGMVWKEYLAHRGKALEDFTWAWLATGRTEFARHAADLFALYARQYGELGWANVFDPPGFLGTPILSSSRVAPTSTYGSNWYFKGHCQLLSALTLAESWSPDQRQAVYSGFVLPYATELMKYAGGISNMTDITNHNLLLLGLAFRDANLVQHALYSDAGLLRRLDDITPDGFSSEGRPLNYHGAAMDEYLPSLLYLANANINVPLPRERLLAAVRMPYRRANLAGYVPNAGDCGRGVLLRASPHADLLLAMAPDEEWLYAAAASGTLLARLLRHVRQRPPEREAWRSLLETTPTLFADAGLAILRTGDTAETQLMATLDYGRSPMHAHRDRNSITLSAFGHLYSQGPGTLYNVGSGGMTRGTDRHLDAFCSNGSLGSNVLMVDQQDQLPAIGTLLAWRPDPARQVAVARVPSVRPGVDHTRALVLTQGVLIVLDRIAGAEAHTYDFVYHNFGTATPGPGWSATPLAEPLGHTANYEHIVAPQRLGGSGPVRLTWQVADGARLDLWQLAPAGATAYLGTTGMNNQQTKLMPAPAPSLFTRVTAPTATYLTVLEPYRETPRLAQVTPHGDDGLTLTFQDQTTLTLSLTELLPTP